MRQQIEQRLQHTRVRRLVHRSADDHPGGLLEQGGGGGDVGVPEVGAEQRVGGHPGFVLLDDSGDEPQEVRLRTSPGDYVFVPPFVPHREENPDPAEEAVVVIARSTQEAIVVNLPKLYALPADDA
ncbi:hypothetical protein ACFV6E_02900 [Streptomyces sp. NPDC059785]|uniref:hypothetical protein n=1 Tax=Streptomyces sp. NPDC059785 TaxID=3346945 RepID=UPI00364CA83D